MGPSYRRLHDEELWRCELLWGPCAGLPLADIGISTVTVGRRRRCWGGRGFFRDRHNEAQSSGTSAACGDL